MSWLVFALHEASGRQLMHTVILINKKQGRWYLTVFCKTFHKGNNYSYFLEREAKKQRHEVRLKGSS